MEAFLGFSETMAHDEFDISLGRHLMSSLVDYTSGFWRWLGGLETRVLADDLEDVELEAPIYIGGLARSGSTILLRVVASAPNVVTHQYRDFPFLHIPYWWQQTLDRQVKGQLEPAERAHKDRLKVTPESPEAMEEVIWMAFFSDLHDPSTSNVLDAETSNPEFESFYENHLRKMLLARNGARYAAKGNYNVTRFEYIQKLFSDARFVIPVRHPRTHVASSRKQHRLFCEGIEEGSRALAHLKRVGHFEFGPHRRPINVGDTEEVRAIESLWSRGEEVRGWARYWACLYGYVADRLEANPALRDASIVVRYEDLCDETDEQLERLFSQCGLEESAEALVGRFRDEISRPDYYDADFSEKQEAAIVEETSEVAARFGYASGEDEIAEEFAFAG